MTGEIADYQLDKDQGTFHIGLNIDFKDLAPNLLPSLATFVLQDLKKLESEILKKLDYLTPKCPLCLMPLHNWKKPANMPYVVMFCCNCTSKLQSYNASHWGPKRTKTPERFGAPTCKQCPQFKIKIETGPDGEDIYLERWGTCKMKFRERPGPDTPGCPIGRHYNPSKYIELPIEIPWLTLKVPENELWGQ